MSHALLLRSVLAPTLPFHFLGEVCVVGRAGCCDLVVSDPSVSRRHAEIRCGPDKVVLTDLGSRNGTYLDDQRIATCTAASGQRVRFGTVAFVLSLCEAADLDEQQEEDTESRKEKPPAEVGSAIPSTYLSPAQQRVFELLRDGQAEKNIAKNLILSVHTVHNHIRAIYRAFHVRSRAELLASLMRQHRAGD